MIDVLIETDIVQPVEGDTSQQKMRARWKQGYKTGVAAERSRMKAYLRQAKRDGVELDYKTLLEVVDAPY
jgi:hypothetical protein